MNIIIFNSLLLPPSQTFIRDPAEKLERFTAYYVGSRRVEGLELPAERTFVVNRGNFLGKVEEQFFKLTGFAPQLYQQVKELSPVLIHAQFGLSGVLMLPWVEDLGIPLIVHYRGADATISEADSKYTSLNHWLYFRKKDTLKKKTHLFLTVSQFIRQKLISQGFPEDKIINHYHGVDIQKFIAKPQIKREPIVLFVGRLTAKKGCKYLIEAMSLVQRECPNVELVIIGDGPLRAELTKTAQKSLRKYQFLGIQPPENVKSWMNRAWLLAAPSVTSSLGDAEGLPNVVLEAQAMSLPVVSTVHAGIPEAVVDSVTGYLSPEADSQSLARSMMHLLQDHTTWQSMSYKGREHVEAHFDRAKQTKVLERIYESVLSGEI